MPSSPSAGRAPLVSAIVAAYNYEQYLPACLDSALNQDYPADRLEIVVVDDGSTDGTPEVLAEYEARHPGRIRAFRQPNGGYLSATNRAMKESRGDLLAVLDADDVWYPHKTRAQVDLLARRPEVMAVYGDMHVIDQDDVVAPRTVFDFFTTGNLSGRQIRRLLFANCATASSIMVRASLAHLYDPIPPGITYADWWYTTQAALAGEIDFLREPCAGYRVHGANLTGGVDSGPGLVRERKKTLQQQRWYLRHIARGQATVADLVHAVGGMGQMAQMTLAAAESPFVDLLTVTSEDRERAADLRDQAARAIANGELELGVFGLAQAYGADPYDLDIRSAFVRHAQDFVARYGDAHGPVAGPATAVLAGARRFKTLILAEEVAGDPDLLSAYGAAFTARDDASLVIYAPGAGDELIARLQETVADAGLDGDDAPDLIALPIPADDATEAVLSGGVDAVLSRSRPTARWAAPWFTPTQTDDLKALAAARTSALTLAR